MSEKQKPKKVIGILVPFSKMLSSSIMSNRYYFLLNGKLTTGTGKKVFSRGTKYVQFDWHKEVKYVNKTDTKQTVELAKQHKIPVLHARKIKRIKSGEISIEEATKDFRKKKNKGL